MAWNEQRVEQMKQLWADRVSASEIAEILGTTKSAVCGLRLRLNLPKREQKRAEPRKKVSEAKAPVMPRKFAPEPFVARTAAIEPLNIEFMALRPGQCRSPEGKEKPFLYCGHPVKPGSSYCEGHHAIYCNKPKPNQKDAARPHFSAVLRKNNNPTVAVLAQTILEEAA